MMVTPECLLRIVSRRGVEVFAYGSMTPPAAVTDVMDVANITNSNMDISNGSRARARAQVRLGGPGRAFW